MTTQRHDLIVIGGGSGGLAVAEKAAQLGASTALIEASAMGGTCVHRGCVPKKVMWYAAQLAHAADDAPDFGIPIQRGVTDWPKLVQSRQRYIDDINSYWDDYVTDLGITRIDGYGTFVDAETVSVQGKHYKAPHIVIATGSRPLLPDVPGAELGITSDGFFQLKQLPQRVAIIGGGYIGVELSGMLKALGSQVTLVAKEDRLLHHFDATIGDVLEQQMLQQGIHIKKNHRVTALHRHEDGLSLRLDNVTQLTGFDTVIWAVGRKPNTSGLNLDKAGVNTLANGVIPVNEDESSNIAGIYAIGDVIGKAPLTPVAIAAGRKLAERLYAQKTDLMNYQNIPSVVFAHPPVGTVGMSEQNARQAFGHDQVRIYQSEFTPMRHALGKNAATTLLKLVCHGEDEKIAGIHIIGDGADEMLQGFAVAVNMGARKSDFDRTVAIHPTSAEELVTMKQPLPQT